MSEEREMWHHSKRCPECLELGKLRYQFGYYVCDKCDRSFASDTLGHFNRAFDMGREFASTTPTPDDTGKALQADHSPDCDVNDRNPDGMNTEAEARRLRAAIYGDVSEVSWVTLSRLWMRPDNLFWLRQNQPVHCKPCPEGMHWKTWNNHEDAP